MEEQSYCAEYPGSQIRTYRLDTEVQSSDTPKSLEIEDFAKRRMINPRVSLVALLFLNVIAFATPFYGIIVAAIVMDFILLVWCGRVKMALCWVLGYVVVCSVFCVCMVLGSSFAPVGACFLYMSKIFPAAMLASAMIATTHTGELAYSLQAFGLPSRVTVATCVALRFFPTIAREARSVNDAMRLRNERLTALSILKSPGAFFESFVVPFVNRISIVADELGDAVMARGGDTTRRRTSLYEARVGLPDIILLLAVLVLLALVVVGRLV